MKEIEGVKQKFLALSLQGVHPGLLSRLLRAYLEGDQEVIGGKKEARTADLLRYLREEPPPKEDPTLLLKKHASSEYGLWVCSYFDPDYPALLKELVDPPALLYGRGEIQALRAPSVSLVGTRKASSYGLTQANRFARFLAQAGLVVVSGLALGVDGAAHQGALEAGGRTLAVLPCGADQIYPQAHAKLASEICRTGGALLTEYPPGQVAQKHHFILRNRIIAGLSRATLVVEARKKSGTMITAHHAAEQSRDLYALPGNISQPRSAGCNWLIRHGAILAADPLDLLASYEDLALDRPGTALGPVGTSGGDLPEPKQLIYDTLSKESLPPVLLYERLHDQLPDFWVYVTRLELRGIIYRDASGQFALSGNKA